MYSITEDAGIYTLRDTAADVTAAVFPARGALLTRLTIHGKELVYTDAADLAAPDRPHCGMPILFPACGRTPDETVTLKGQPHPMPIHGFGHTSVWQVSRAEADENAALLTLTLQDSPATREMYPYAFRVELTFRLAEGVLGVTFACTNTDPEPLPFDHGYHPYFRISSLEQAYIELPDGRSFTLPDGPQTGQMLPSQPGPVLLKNTQTRTGVAVDYEPVFNVMVIWGIPAKKFLCVEPWRASEHGLRGTPSVLLAPGETLQDHISLRPFLF